MYVYNRDKSHRPILILNVKRILDTDIEEEILLKYTLYWLEHVISKGMVSGHVENFFVLLDCDDVGVTEIPKAKLKAMVGVIQSNYRGRLFRLFAINVPIMLRAAWKLFKGWVDPFTAAKMHCRGGLKKYKDDLLEYVDRSNLEEKYGGELPNKTSGFYPPAL